jgi:AcrR family transcriptional regulator
MDKQEQILKAALKLFVEFGFHGTPTSKIAQEAGVSNGTLFHYYKTKDELVVALYVYIKSNLAACFDTQLAEGETIKNSFKRMYLGWMYWGLENPVEFKYTQQFRSSPYLPMVADERLKAQNDRLISMMEEAINARILKPLPADLVMNLINNQVYGLNEYLMNSNLDSNRQKELIELSFDLIWDMIT